MSPAGAGAAVVNPGAEQDGGWSGSQARFASYGEGPSVPSAQFAAEQLVSAGQRGLGTRLFALGPAGRLEQVVDVSQWATGIDAGTAPLYAGAWLGADGAAQGGARLTATPLDAQGQALAPAAFAGPPTRADRASLAVLVPCEVEFTPTPGTRQVRLALEGVAPYQAATADVVYLANFRRGLPFDEGYPHPNGHQSPGGQGPGCGRWETTPLGSVGPFLPPPSHPKPDCRRDLPAQQSTAGPTPGLPAPQPRPAPPIPPCVSPLRVSRVMLTRTRLSLSVSRAATLRVQIARRAARSRAAKWHRVRGLTVRARSAGRITRRLRRLRPGRYQISIRSSSQPGGKLQRRLTRTVKR